MVNTSINLILKNISPQEINSILPTNPKDENALNYSVIQKWSGQHRIEKHQGIGFIAHIVRKIGLVFSAALLLIISPFLILYNIGSALNEKYRLYRYPDGVLAVIRKMKIKEETDKLHTMQDILGDFSKIDLQSLSPESGAKKLTEKTAATLNQPELIQKRAARYILREISQNDSFDPQWMRALSDPEIVNKLDLDKLNLTSTLNDFGNCIKQKYPGLKDPVQELNRLDWKRICHKAKKNTLPPKPASHHLKQFEASLSNLLKILHNQKGAVSPVSSNRKLIAALRKCLASPVYQTLKEDSSEPSVELLHRLASDIWNKSPSMEAYREVGKNIIKQASIEINGEEIEGPSLARKLKASHKKMEKLHYVNHTLPGKICYAFTHPFLTLGGLASVGGMARHIPGMVGLDQYDSHGSLSNNPSLQGVTKVTFENDKVGTIHNCYGGTPTIGDHKIAPEFEAVIQAAENNQMAPEALRNKKIPMMVVYNNLQNLDMPHGEGPRSRTLMLLNKKYPLSFRGTTFSKDSPLYLMKTSQNVIWTGEPSEFGQKMKNQLEKSFDPNAKKHGFYFHGGKDRWEPIFSEVIHQANVHFEAAKEQKKELWDQLKPSDLQGAYQEYVYSLLNAVIEMQSLETLLERNINHPFAMVITACKENIDRGGMENTKYLYNRLAEDMEKKERLALIVGAMHSRALSARDRLILPERMPSILNFMKTTSPKEFKQSLKAVFNGLGFRIKGSEFQPYLKN